MGRVSAAKIACIALTACLLACGVPSYGGSALAPAPAEAASAPAYNARLTQKNMLRLVRAYDSDAYRILRAQDRAGDSFATWMQGSERLVDAVDTTVHEEFHSFTHTYGGYVVRNGSIRLQDLYYLGGKKTRKVTTTAVFKSTWPRARSRSATARSGTRPTSRSPLTHRRTSMASTGC